MSNGTNSEPERSDHDRRKSSNIAFHALRWTLAVSVNTPSRSNRQAWTPSGRPNTWHLLRSSTTGARLAPIARMHTHFCKKVRLRSGRFAVVAVLEVVPQ